MKCLMTFTSILLILISPVICAQESSENIKPFFDEALTDYTAYENLRTLCKNYKGRISGTDEAAGAVNFTFKVLSEMNLSRVEKQSVQVLHWKRGEPETAYYQSLGKAKIPVHISALGTSIGTGVSGLTANVIEVQNFEELANLGKDKIAGKIVFFNRAMDPTLVNTFSAYSGAAQQRTMGAAQAAKFGAAGVIIRSLTTAIDTFAHTGVMSYVDSISKIPAVAICTLDANKLSESLKSDPNLDFYFKTTCENLPEVESYNVIGEIRGTVLPDEIITIGGHLDAWDTGEGAHDDGAGCVQSIEVLRLFQKLGIKPKRTIRAVMFMDEEIAQRGGKEYARQAELKNEKHYFALEADRGAFTPKGFGVSAPDERLQKILALQKYFETYGINQFVKGGGGVDIGPLAKFGTPLSSFVPDMQRYFDMHHSGNDTFEQINFREFQLGSAAIASFIYLIDKGDL